MKLACSQTLYRIFLKVCRAGIDKILLETAGDLLTSSATG